MYIIELGDNTALLCQAPKSDLFFKNFVESPWQLQTLGHVQNLILGSTGVFLEAASSDT